MATHVKNELKRSLLAAWAAGADVRLILCMSNTTADSENDGIVYVDDITTLDEFDGAKHSRKALASGSVSKDDGNDRGEFDAADVTYAALGAGTRDIVGILAYEHVNDDTDSLVGIWFEFSSPKTPDGSDFTLQWNAEGILQA